MLNRVSMTAERLGGFLFPARKMSDKRRFRHDVDSRLRENDGLFE